MTTGTFQNPTRNDDGSYTFTYRERAVRLVAGDRWTITIEGKRVRCPRSAWTRTAAIDAACAHIETRG